ncbi:MAG: hypothetical protein J5594_03765 [Elusimicrobiaceae bacterium]|nr:hypothetical protein [Elusimicrobiaceae bacterium]
MICWKCKSDIGEFDNYCKYCGAGQGSHIPFYYRHIGIILLFFILGPFNLYFVWRSPSLKIVAKTIYTIIFLALTGWFCYKTYLLFLQAQSMLGSFPTNLMF